MGNANFYDELAPHFRSYSERRRAYLSRIDDLVVRSLRGTSLLDVGAGDGVRALRLSRRAGLQVVRRRFVDYGSGRLRRTWLEGQLFYELAPPSPG